MKDEEIKYPCSTCPQSYICEASGGKSRHCKKWADWFRACWRLMREKFGIDTDRENMV